MQVGVERGTHATILHLKGEFDSFYCQPLLDKVEEQFDGGTNRVIFNLLRVRFINSTALGTLIKISKACKRRGGNLAISTPSPVCKKVIESLGLNAVLPMFGSDAEAEEFLAGEAPAPAAPSQDLVAEDDSAVLFFPVDEARTNEFIPEKERSRPLNPVHGHAFGSKWRGVGRMSALDANGLRFTWDGGQTGLEPERMKEMLAPGTELKVRFRLPFLQRRFSDAVVTVNEADAREESIRISTEFTEIEAKTLEAVEQYVTDMAYLRKETRRAKEEGTS